MGRKPKSDHITIGAAVKLGTRQRVFDIGEDEEYFIVYYVNTPVVHEKIYKGDFEDKYRWLKPLKNNE